MIIRKVFIDSFSRGRSIQFPGLSKNWGPLWMCFLGAGLALAGGDALATVQGAVSAPRCPMIFPPVTTVSTPKPTLGERGRSLLDSLREMPTTFSNTSSVAAIASHVTRITASLRPEIHRIITDHPQPYFQGGTLWSQAVINGVPFRQWLENELDKPNILAEISPAVTAGELIDSFLNETDQIHIIGNDLVRVRQGTSAPYLLLPSILTEAFRAVARAQSLPGRTDADLTRLYIEASITEKFPTYEGREAQWQAISFYQNGYPIRSRPASLSTTPLQTVIGVAFAHGQAGETLIYGGVDIVLRSDSTLIVPRLKPSIFLQSQFPVRWKNELRRRLQQEGLDQIEGQTSPSRWAVANLLLRPRS